MGRRKAEFTGHITYRLRQEDFDSIQSQANAQGITPREWCRRAALEKLATRPVDKPDEWAMYLLIAQIRFLLGHGLRLMASDSLTMKEWERVRSEADRSAAAIATDLLKRGKE